MEQTEHNFVLSSADERSSNNFIVTKSSFTSSTNSGTKVLLTEIIENNTQM